MQHEITESHNLLDENNNIIEPGYAKKMIPIYNKKTDLKTRFHTKEWDYYYIGDEHYGLALTLADNGYMGLDSISLLNFDEKWSITKSPMQFMTLGKKNFPTTSVQGNIGWGNKNYSIQFDNDGKIRHLYGFMNRFLDKETIRFDVTLSDIPEESMVICTPFEKSGHFYYNQKINCMKASGTIECGQLKHTFDPENANGTLDWGRGIWTYKNTWYWSSLSTVINGHRFGFNLGYGFGDNSAASENMLFYDGKAHKLEAVDFGLPKIEGKDAFLSHWKFTSSDNRVNLLFEPIHDRASCSNALIIESDQHQVFGRFYGNCVLDDETEISLNGQIGFAEKVKNKW